MEKFDLIVLGSGPGGYVTAIRASQLGLKTAIIEKESLGGVCLNWGCIPTKALLKSAQVFDYLKNAKDYGISVNEINKDFNAVVKRSRKVADSMSKGVTFLLKKNKIKVFNGFGKLTNDHTHKTKKEAVFSYNKGNFFGSMGFDLDANDPTMTFRCVTIEGKEVHSMTLKRSSLQR